MDENMFFIDKIGLQHNICIEKDLIVLFTDQAGNL